MAVSQNQFWSQMAPKYEVMTDSQLGKTTRSLILEKLNAEGRLGKAMEFGCGTGFLTKVLSGKSDSLIATDLADGMLKIASENLKGYENVHFR